MWTQEDHAWMEAALAQAEQAAALGEVPVGAVVVRCGTLLASAHNLRETRQDPTAHAELLALRAAAAALNSWRLDDCTLYCTLEPCPMCAGALWLARVARLVYGAADKKAGAAGTLYNVVRDPRLNHQVRTEGGLLDEESRALLRRFFRQLRGKDGVAANSEGCPSG